MVITASTAPSPDIESRPSRRRILPLLALFIAVSSAAAPLLVVGQQALHIPTDALRITQFSTAFGALAVFVAAKGQPLAPRVSRRGVGGPLVAAVVLGLLYAGSVWGSAAVTGRTADHSAALSTAVPFVVVLQLLGALGEEVGWRGVVQPMLETRMNVLGAATFTGLLFGAGHWFVLADGVAYYALFVTGSVMLSWGLAAVSLGLNWWQRTMAATVLHWLVNVSLIVLPVKNVEGVTIPAIVGMLAVGAASLPVLLRHRSRVSTGASPVRQTVG